MAETMLQMASWVKKAEKGREKGQARGEEWARKSFTQTPCQICYAELNKRAVPDRCSESLEGRCLLKGSPAAL